jgi:hypothetical protein
METLPKLAHGGPVHPEFAVVFSTGLGNIVLKGAGESRRPRFGIKGVVSPFPPMFVPGIFDMHHLFAFSFPHVENGVASGVMFTVWECQEKIERERE